MAGATEDTTVSAHRKSKSIPHLELGDRLDQRTFHERYENMGPGVRAELIEGIVHLPSPVGGVHSEEHALLILWLGSYLADTPGVKLHDNPTVIFSQECEPQPDAVLRLVPGQTRLVQEGQTAYIAGPPEFVAEVASSSESVDLHAKRRDYERYGVQEYLVFLVRTRAIFWFVRDGGRFVEKAPDSNGILKSQVFPGLWLDPVALLTGDIKRMQKVLKSGLVSSGHGKFAASLAKSFRGGQNRK